VFELLYESHVSCWNMLLSYEILQDHYSVIEMDLGGNVSP
jgi:hypothetical protein